MPIQKLTSPWDYIAQGIEGIGTGREQARQREMQDFSVIANLFGAGAVGSEQLNQAAARTSIPSLKGLTAIPSVSERKNKILSDPNADPDDKAEAIGMTGPTARRTQRASAESAELGLGSQRRQDAAEPGRIARTEKSETDKAFESDAERFVKGSITDPMTVTSANRKQIVDAAFNRYLAMRNSTGVGKIPDEAYAREFFDKAFSDFLIEKKKLEIQEKAATVGRMTPEDRLFVQVGQQLERVRKAIDDVKANKMVSMFLGKDPSEVPDWVRADVERYNNLVDTERQLEEAQLSVADPRIVSAMRSRVDQAVTPAGAPSTRTVEDGYEQRVQKIVKAASGMETEKAVQLINQAVGTPGGPSKDEAAEAIKRLRKSK